jgi:uncharacterized protein involved in cysteine biosynthesis
MNSLSGISSFARGCLSAFNYPNLALKCAFYSAVLLLAWLVAVWFGADAIIHNWLGDSYEELFWDRLLRYATWVILFVIGISAAPMMVSSLMALIAPSVRGELFDRVIQASVHKRGSIQLHSGSSEPLSVMHAIRIDIYRIVYALCGSVFFGLIGFFIAVPIWGLVQFTFTLWCLGVDTVGLDHERRGRNRRAQDKINKQQRTLVFGVGLITFVLYVIPIVQLAAPMLVTAGAANLSLWREAQEATF